MNPRNYSVRACMLMLVWAVLTIMLIAAGHIAAHSSAVAAFDRHITSSVVARRSPGLNALMKTATWLGSWVALAGAGILLAVLVATRRVPVLGVILAVVVWIGETLGVSLAKLVVQRARPPRDLWLVTAHGWSWPSGHAGTAMVVFSILAVTVCYLTRSRLLRMAAWVAAVVAVAAVGLSRVELGVHWTTDVVSSVVFVSLWLIAVVVLVAPVSSLGLTRARESQYRLRPPEDASV